MKNPIKTPLRIDSRPIRSNPEEIRCFISLRNELMRLPVIFDYCRSLGVERFFALDNNSNDGSREFVLEQPDCHVFHTEGSHFEHNISPPHWQNAVLNVHGDGHWCLIVDADELLVYPHCETLPLKDLCAYLDGKGCDSLVAPQIDMYGAGPVASTPYRKGDSFLGHCPWFDPEPGWLEQQNEGFPGFLMFGGVRERVFMRNQFRYQKPPCLTKVPLVKWRKDRGFIHATHLINKARLPDIQGALLHFKFLTGFAVSTQDQIRENTGLKEKTLEERAAYADALRRDPELKLWNEASMRYEGSAQLVRLGWNRTSDDYEIFIRSRTLRSSRDRDDGLSCDLAVG